MSVHAIYIPVIPLKYAEEGVSQCVADLSAGSVQDGGLHIWGDLERLTALRLLRNTMSCLSAAENDWTCDTQKSSPIVIKCDLGKQVFERQTCPHAHWDTGTDRIVNVSNDVPAKISRSQCNHFFKGSDGDQKNSEYQICAMQGNTSVIYGRRLPLR